MSNETINGTNTNEKDFLALNTDELKKELYNIFFDKQKAVPENPKGYIPLINQAQKIIARIDERKIEDKKAELMKLIGDEYKDLFEIVEKKGRGKAKGKKPATQTSQSNKITIRYMNEHNQPDQVEIGLKGPAPSDNPSLKAFLAYAKDTKSKARKDLDVNVMSIEEFRDTFQGYKYTAA